MFGLGVGVFGLGWGKVDVNEELKFFVKIQKKNIGGCGRGGRVGVRVDVNEELKFLGKFTKKKSGGGRVGRVGGGVRVDLNAMLGVGGDVGYGVVNQE